VRRDAVELIERIGAIPGLETLAMTTNALTLSRKIPQLVDAGLTHVNISLDTLLDFKFEIITRRRGFAKVMKGIEDSIAAGLRVKINCVVMKNFNEDELCDFVAMTEDWPVDVRFIEWMPFDGNKWTSNKMVPYVEMVDTIKKQYPRFERDANDADETAKAWRVPGFAGRVGFITSMSDHFCGSCNRLRLTADGNLKVCLFGNTEVSLRDAMRSNISEADLLDLVGAAVSRKKKQHAGMDNLASMKNRPMILIGG
jgi:cyclic pyranopterin phosphate synthase